MANIPMHFDARASFDTDEDAFAGFDLNATRGRRRSSAPDIAALLEKKEPKSPTLDSIPDDRTKNFSGSFPEDRRPVKRNNAKRKTSKAMTELNVKTTIVEDLHIKDAWGTISPTSRGFGDSPAEEFELPSWSQEDPSGLPNKGGLLQGDSVEDRALKMQTRLDRKGSLPDHPAFFSKSREYNDDLTDAMNSISMMEKKGQKLPQTIRRLLIEANLGWTESQFTLGYCYDTGSGGVKASTTDAITWYSEAANAGHVTSQNNLGVLLATGHRGRIKPNHAEAFVYYKKAAENGHPNAEFHVGLAFLKGEGLESKSEKDAFRWFKKAAKQGHVLAVSNVGAMYMSGQGVGQNFTKAHKWSKKAAAHGSAIAQHNLGVMYHHGLGVKADRAKSEEYIRAATTGANKGAITKQLSKDTLRAGNTLLNM